MINSVFISYRRDDAAGEAGRLEASLERRIGRGGAFRDVIDLVPGDDFAAAIQQRLAGARGVVALIGPRWAGAQADGARRIDDPQDFVRRELTLALQSAARVVPVLLRGATLPSAAELPAPLQALAARQALTLGDTHWEDDVDRLVSALGVVPRRRVWAKAAAVTLFGAGLAAAAVGLWRGAAEPAAEERLLGVWTADVRYGWGDRYRERFEFKRHAGELTGTATFLAFPRAIEALTLDGANVHFRLRSIERMGESTRELTHAFAGEWRGPPTAPRLALRLQISGGHHSQAPIEFEAQRLTPADLAASAAGKLPPETGPRTP